MTTSGGWHAQGDALLLSTRCAARDELLARGGQQPPHQLELQAQLLHRLLASATPFDLNLKLTL